MPSTGGMYLRGGVTGVCPTTVSPTNVFGFYPSLLPTNHTSSYYPMATLTANGLYAGNVNTNGFEAPAQVRKLFIGGLNHETDDSQVIFYYY